MNVECPVCEAQVEATTETWCFDGVNKNVEKIGHHHDGATYCQGSDRLVNMRPVPDPL